MNSEFDLHLHSNASDGEYSPADLVAAVEKSGVRTMALTDHDTVFGLARASAAASAAGLRFVNGIEHSASWEGRTLHIIGLDIDPEHPALLDALGKVQEQRRERARKIADKLARQGVHDTYPEALCLAANGMITRPHFARLLIGRGVVKDARQAFERYLARGKSAYVPVAWPALGETIGLIHAAGGVAVLAHPLRYKFTGAWMRRLLRAFGDSGGQAIEVICGNYTPTEINTSVGYALRFAFNASVGSDFHGPSKMSRGPGGLPPLPSGLAPVWDLFR